VKQRDYTPTRHILQMNTQNTQYKNLDTLCHMQTPHSLRTTQRKKHSAMFLSNRIAQSYCLSPMCWWEMLCRPI